MTKYLMAVFFFGFVVSANSYGADITCNVASAIDGKNQPGKKIVLDITSNGSECAKSETYIIPGTSVEVTVHGHFDCDPSEGFCPYMGPSVDGVEIHDKAGRNYSQAMGSCEKASEFINSQLISQTKARVNVVVTCNLNK